MAERLILAIDTASHNTGYTLYSIDRQRIVLTFRTEFNYEDKTFDTIEYLKFLKRRFGKVYKKFKDGVWTIEKIVMEKQWSGEGTIQSSLETLQEAHSVIKSYFFTAFECEIIEVEPIAWKTIAAKFVIGEYVDYRDKQTWLKKAQELFPTIKTEDEADSFWMMKSILFVDDYIRKNNKPFFYFTNTFTVVGSINKKDGGVYKITKTNNKNK